MGTKTRGESSEPFAEVATAAVLDNVQNRQGWGRHAALPRCLNSERQNQVTQFTPLRVQIYLIEHPLYVRKCKKVPIGKEEHLRLWHL